MKIAVYIIIGLVVLILIWVIGEEIYNTGYRQGRQDGYREGVKDGSYRTKKRNAGL